MIRCAREGFSPTWVRRGEVSITIFLLCGELLLSVLSHYTISWPSFSSLFVFPYLFSKLFLFLFLFPFLFLCYGYFWIYSHSFFGNMILSLRTSIIYFNKSPMESQTTSKMGKYHTFLLDHKSGLVPHIFTRPQKCVR